MRNCSLPRSAFYSQARSAGSQRIKAAMHAMRIKLFSMLATTIVLSCAAAAQQTGQSTTQNVDRKLEHPANEAESEAAHAAARWYAEKLLTGYGRAQVIQWLRNGVPGHALASLQH
jgi:hypothetical protein